MNSGVGSGALQKVRGLDMRVCIPGSVYKLPDPRQGRQRCMWLDEGSHYEENAKPSVLWITQ